MTFQNQLRKIARWSWRKLLAILPEKQRDKFFKNRNRKAEPKQLTPQCEMLLYSSIPARVPTGQMELLEQLREHSKLKLKEGVFFQELVTQIEKNQAVISTTIVNGTTNDPEETHLMILYPNRGENRES